MIKLYLIIATLIFFVEAFIRLQKIAISFYPRKPSPISKNEDKTYFIVYLAFVFYGLLAIFMP